MNYSACVQRLRPFTAPLRAYIGAPKSDWEWDLPRGGTELASVKRVLTFVNKHIDTMASLGAPIWPLEPSTLMHLWVTGRLPEGMRVVVITWDASEHGVAFAIREEPHRILHCIGRAFDNVSSVATFTDPSRSRLIVRAGEGRWQFGRF